jgi:DNA-binding transcriptional MerR regulator
MYSGELARLAGVSADTLRFYERHRLLPSVARSAAGYRHFSPQALQRVQIIRAALALGFSIRELSSILPERDLGHAPCRRVRELAAAKLAALEGHLRELQTLRRVLRSRLADWDMKLRKIPRGQRAGLLDSLADHRKRQARSLRLGACALGRGDKE